MGKRLNLINQTFNYLTVIADTDKHDSSNKRLWQCKCKCGNITYATSQQLKSGAKKSCGCAQRQAVQKTGLANKGKRTGPTEDLTGQKFGKLTVLYYDKKYSELKRKDSNGMSPYWLCRCECGNEIFATGSSLKYGTKISCGCYKRSLGEEKINKILTNNNIPFEEEKMFSSCRFPETNRMARFDFYVDNKYLIQYDGKQHFEKCNNNNFYDIDEIQKRDQFKNNWCKENNIPLIRIPYKDFTNINIQNLKLQTTKYRVV